MKTTTATALALIGVIAAGSAAAMVNTTIFDSAPSEAAASAVILPESQMIDLTIPQPLATVPHQTETPASDASATTDGVTAMVASASATEQVADTTTTVVPTPTTTTPSTTTPSITAPSTTTPSITATSTTAPTATSTTLRPPATSTTASPTTTVAEPPMSPTTYNLDQAGSVTLDVINGRLLIVDTNALPGWMVTKASHDSVTGAVEVTFESAALEVTFEAALVNGQIVPEVSSDYIAPVDDHDDDDHDDDDDDRDDD